MNEKAARKDGNTKVVLDKGHSPPAKVHFLQQRARGGQCQQPDRRQIPRLPHINRPNVVVVLRNCYGRFVHIRLAEGQIDVFQLAIIFEQHQNVLFANVHVE